MTAKELHRLALRRNRTLAANAGHSFTLRSFRHWLDQQVESGLLRKHGYRYYLTDDGWWVATALADVRP